MIQEFNIEGLKCQCVADSHTDRIAYILYPMDILTGWMEEAARKYATGIVVITGMDWESVFSPWPAPGVPKGSDDFKGKSPEFLTLMQQKVIPQIENMLGVGVTVERTLAGVSMSGLFALWQWMICDTFTNIASLSGSFWYEGFLEWMKSRPIPKKQGMAFFLLGNQEARSKVFGTVEANTTAIVSLLSQAGIKTQFESVPGNHYSDPIPRLDKAFSAIYLNSTQH